MLHATTEQSADNNVSTVGLEEVSVDLEGLYDHVRLRAQRK
jgi:predicted helicase